MLGLTADTLAELKAAVGDGAWLDAHEDLSAFTVDFRRLYRGVTPLVLLPRNVDQVSPRAWDLQSRARGRRAPGRQYRLLRRRHARTSRARRSSCRCASSIGCARSTRPTTRSSSRPDAPSRRLTGGPIRASTVSVEPGIGGTAQIGGNLSTNAGGTAVLRYGMMRDLVLGLEVVLADGRVLSGLKSLRKDNTGYDVKSLFIGAEGTLGVITAACLKLFPEPATAPPHWSESILRAALELLALLRGSAGEALTAFELMPRIAVELTVEHIAGSPIRSIRAPPGTCSSS